MQERYEAKYTIPESMIGPISCFVENYCQLDYHSQIEKDHFYQINSLYLDTPNNLFLQQRLDQATHRFNMRIRTYGQNSQWPAFFEIKKKEVNIIRKQRAKIENQIWLNQLQGIQPRKETTLQVVAVESDYRRKFILLAMAYGATPKVLTNYQRKAYVSDIDDYARVTFDKAMCYQASENYNLLPKKSDMIPLDHELRFDGDCNIVLELKCYATQVPLWMVDLIKTFQLKRRSFSKYANGALEVLGQWHYSKYDRINELFADDPFMQ